MRRVIFGIILFLIVLIGLFIILPYPAQFLVEPFKERIEKEITSRTEYPVSIGNIKFLFFNRAVLEDITLGAPYTVDGKGVQCSIERVILSFNLFRFIFKRTQSLPAIKKIRISTFKCRVPYSLLLPGGVQSRSFPDIYWEDGMAVIVNNEFENAYLDETRINNGEGFMRSTAQGTEVSCSGQLADIGALGLSGVLTKENKWNAVLSGRIFHLSSDHIQSIGNIISGTYDLPAQISGIEYRGTSAVELRGAGNLHDPGRLFSEWNVNLLISSSTITRVYDDRIISGNVQGLFVLNKETCTVSSGILSFPYGSVLRIEGRLEQPFDEKKLDLKVDVDRLTSKDVPRIPSLSWLKDIEYSGSASGMISGSVSRPVIDMKIDGLSWNAGEKIKGDISLQLKYNNANWRISNIFIETAGGAIHGEAHGMHKNWFATMTGSALRIDKLAAVFPGNFIDGIINGSMTCSWNNKSAEVSGMMNISNARLFKQAYEKINANLRYRNGRTTVEAHSPGREVELNIDIRKEDQVLRLHQFILTSPALVMKSSGMLIDAENTMNIDLVCRDMPVSHLPAAQAVLDRFSGTINFAGSVKGQWNNPLLIGKLLASDDSGEYCGMEISADKNEIRFLNFSFLERLTGSGAWNLTNDEMNFTINEQELELARVNEFFNIPMKIAGNVSGSQTFLRKIKTQPSQTPPKSPVSVATDIFETVKQKIHALISEERAQEPSHVWEGKGVLRLEGGYIQGVQYKTISLSGFLSQEKLQVDEFHVIQEKGDMYGKGGIVFGKKQDNLDFKIDCKQWTIEKFICDGELSINGDYSSADDITASIHSPSVWLNGQHVGELEGAIVYQQRILRGEEWSLGKFLSGSIAVNFNHKDPVLSGKLQCNIDKLQFLNELTPIEQWHNIKGSGSMLLELNGTVSKPMVRTILDVSKAQWEGLQFSLQGSLDYGNGIWVIPEISCDFGNKGKLLIEGEYGMKDEKPFSAFNTRLYDLDMSVIRSFIKLPEWITGQINGNVVVSDMPNEPVFSGTLSGKKTGIRGLSVDHWQGNMTLHNNRLDIHKLTLVRNEELWNLTEGSYVQVSPDNQVSFLAHTEIRNIYIGKVSFFGGLTVRGTWDFTRKARHEFEIITQHLWINQHDFERAVIPFSVDDGAVIFKPIETEPYALSGSIYYSSFPAVTVNSFKIHEKEKTIMHLEGNFSKSSADFWFKTIDVDAGTLFEFLGYDQIITGKTGIYWIMSGEYRNPRIICTLNAVNGTIKNIPYDTAQFHWTLRDGLLQIENGLISSPGLYTITVDGTVPLIKGKEIKKSHEDIPVDISLTLENGDLKILSQTFEMFKMSKGIVSGRLDVKGTVVSPTYHGQFSVTNGQITSREYFKTMRDIQILVEYENSSAVIKNCSAQLGEGTVSVTGSCKLGFLSVDSMDLHIITQGKKGIKVEAPMLPISSSPLFKRLTTTSRGSPRLDIQVNGSIKEPNVNGTFYLDHTHFTYPPPPQVLENLGKEHNPIVDFMRRTTWDIVLIAEDNTWYENEFANTMIQGQITIQGKRPDFKVGGKIVSGKGSIGFLGAEFNITNAELEIVSIAHDKMVDGARWNNILYLEGTAETSVYYIETGNNNSIEDTITMVMDRAPIGKLKPRFISRNNSQLSSEKALERATGYDSESVDPNDRDILLRRSIVQLLDATLTTPLARNIARQTGIIDTVRISHETLPSEEQSPAVKDEKTGIVGSELRDAFLGTKYTVGKQLSSKLLLEYSMQIVGSSTKLDLRHEMELSYRLKGNTYIRGVADLNQPYTGLPPERKAVIEKQWRFAWPKKWKDWIKKLTE